MYIGDSEVEEKESKKEDQTYVANPKTVIFHNAEDKFQTHNANPKNPEQTHSL